MYAQLSSQMIRAQQAELERGSLAAQHRRALREARGVSPRRVERMRWLEALSARLAPMGVVRGAKATLRARLG
jgi:hypothetical protein